MDNFDNADQSIRALVRQAISLNEKSEEFQIVVEKLFATARFVYGDNLEMIEKLQVFVAQVVAIKEAEQLLGKRLSFNSQSEGIWKVT